MFRFLLGKNCFPPLLLIIASLWDIPSKDDRGRQDVRKAVTQHFFGNRNDILDDFKNNNEDPLRTEEKVEVNKPLRARGGVG